MEQRRVLLAIALAFVVLYGWQALFVKPVPKPAAGPNTPAPSSAPATPGAAATPATAPPASSDANSPSPTNAPLGPAATVIAASPLVAENTERDVRVETRD